MQNRLHLGEMPSLIVCAFTCTHDADEVATRVHELAPTVPLIGCTTCRGIVLNDTWLTHQQDTALGLWGLSDDAGAYTTIHIQERPGNLRDAVLAEVKGVLNHRSEPPSFAILLG